ncbi:DUF421 domain-containing protein [Acidipila sp. EB88]|uniref:DUF421 domain-containing protein n=1 Tax=Acidipila sp. EB88 TaxID=2305226 RepID=UPI000F602E8E|nr:YetF domain-containing protein [Acidipila sp. EB88]RRA50109.1 DUF421 domain-containing protein [Acidipila sp. EB88]
MAAVLRAAFGYFFLVFMVRIVGRRPGKQMNPFEFVLIFFIGGLALTFTVADDRSLTNAFTQILTIGISHYFLIMLRERYPRIALLLDGSPILLLRKGRWQTEAMEGMLIQADDVMTAARDKGLYSLSEIDYAVLERNGEITIAAVTK